MNKPDDLILPHGGYRKLRSFTVSLAAYDGTVIFCNRFIDRRSRTHDQMVQAARSGVQNIAEGSLASGTSKKTELKLTSVARASLGELIRDYEDYLRQNRLAIWDKDAPKVRAMRARLQGRSKRGLTSLTGLTGLTGPTRRTGLTAPSSLTSLCWRRCRLWKPRLPRFAQISCSALPIRPAICCVARWSDLRKILLNKAVLRKGFTSTGKIIAEQGK